MERHDLIMKLIITFQLKHYLEIGVSAGNTFFSIRCQNKVGVDPRFLFNVSSAAEEDSTAHFYQETSDTFFALHGKLEGPFDLIFLDGLHTAEQVLRDLLNSLSLLAPNGIIVLDDVRPNSYESSIPDQSRSRTIKNHLRNSDTSWMGDVYKVVPFIETFCQFLSYSSPIEIPNCVLVWPSPRPEASIPCRRLLDIASFAFEDTLLYPAIYHPLETEQLLQRIAESRN